LINGTDEQYTWRVDRAHALETTLLALRSVASARHDDAVAAQVERFLSEVPSARDSPEKLDGLRAAVDDWLAHMVGPLIGRIAVLLATARDHDLAKVREVLRAVWVLLGDVAGDARASLAEIGGLLSASLERRDLAGAQRALVAARAWLAKHEWEVAVRLRRAP